MVTPGTDRNRQQFPFLRDTGARSRQAGAMSENQTLLTPKLVVHDADAAIAFYQTALGATLSQRYTAGDQVVYALLEVLGHPVELKDEDTHDPSPTTLGRPGVLLSVTTEDPDGLAQAMLDAGAETVFEVADQPYGARGGRVRDPFGHEWLVQTPITMSPEQIQAAMDQL